MATYKAQDFITGAMFALGVLEPSGAPNAEQQAQYLLVLNEIIEQFQMIGMGGYTLVIAAVTGVTTWTPTVLTQYPDYSSTTTAWPPGWKAALRLSLAVKIAPYHGIGKGAPRFEAIMADLAAALAVITPAKQGISQTP